MGRSPWRHASQYLRAAASLDTRREVSSGWSPGGVVFMQAPPRDMMLVCGRQDHRLPPRLHAGAAVDAEDRARPPRRLLRRQIDGRLPDVRRFADAPERDRLRDSLTDELDQPL